MALIRNGAHHLRHGQAGRLMARVNCLIFLGVHLISNLIICESKGVQSMTNSME